MAVLLAAGILLSGCGAGGDEASRDSNAAGGSTLQGGSAPEAGAKSGADNGVRTDGSTAGGATSPQGPTSTPGKVKALVVSRDMIYRGSVTVRVKNVTSATRRAEQIVNDAGGVIHAEETSTEGPDGTSRAHLTLRVPPTEFRAVMAKLSSDLGTGLRKSQTAEDVTTQIVDTASRIETQRTSVRRVRLLLDKATNLDDIMRLESEVAKREGDLESLEAQLARLKDVTAEATIEVELVEKAAVVAKPKEKERDAGFLVGFRAGWDAFVEIVLVGLTVLGALLPFVLTAGLLGVPLWLVVRSRLRRRVVAPEATAV